MKNKRVFNSFIISALEARRKYLIENEDNIRKEKLCLIDDVIRVKKLLFGMGEQQHNEFLLDSTAGQLFDTLYDLDITALKVIMRGYEIKVNELSNQLVNKNV